MAGRSLARRRSWVSEPSVATLEPLPEDYDLPMTWWDSIKVFNSKHLGALIWKNLLWMWRNRP